MQILKKFWASVRQLSGDDAYERYLAQHALRQECGCASSGPMTKAEFFRQWQDAKWQGIKRCC